MFIDDGQAVGCESGEKMSRLKFLAVYLPQFHRLSENDEWWGEGFTEWTTVRAAERLFDGHDQPREPLNDNYYNLMEEETMRWQAELAEKYGVYGFCFYHYYFKDGRKILEKPAENLLKWKGLNMHFCFCWANETWARTWSKISGANSWSEKFEIGKEESGVLLEQDYGDKEDWQKHFEYLISFFKDERYIKIDNKPIFIFYKPDSIPVFGEMVSLWNELAIQEGFSGIYSIAINSFEHEEADAVLLHGPSAYENPKIIGESVEEERDNQVCCMDYEAVWKNAINCIIAGDKTVYYGGFVDYDDTPRRGKLGSLLKNVHPDLFEKYMYRLAVKNIALNNEFVFINAWNEWGEGNYLEPDKKNKYAYLEALNNIEAKCNATDFDCIDEWNKFSKNREIDEIGRKERELLREVKRYQKCYYLLDRWMLLKEKNIALENYFIDNRFERIIIYGFAAIGKHLFEELRNTSIQVVCAIDRRDGLKYPGIEIISLTEAEKIPDVDAIVVTVIQDAEVIVRKLETVFDKPIVILENIIFGRTTI